jgi:hypothetical protein
MTARETTLGTDRCGCQPGTHEDGWQEQRSPECVNHDRDAWKGLPGIIPYDEEEA